MNKFLSVFLLFSVMSLQAHGVIHNIDSDHNNHKNKTAAHDCVICEVQSSIPVTTDIPKVELKFPEEIIFISLELDLGILLGRFFSKVSLRGPPVFL